MSKKKIITDGKMPSKIKPGDQRSLREQRQGPKNDPLADVWVTAHFWCPECKTKYGEYLKQAWLRRLPRQRPWKGKMMPTRQPDGTILKLCGVCVEQLKRFVEARRNRRKII